MKLVGIALALTIVHGILRALGLGVHTSVIAGMPIDSTSYVLGPIYALSWIAFVTVAPVLALTAAFDAFWIRGGRGLRLYRTRASSRSGRRP